MSVGWPQDSRVSWSVNQPAINHLVQLSVLGQWSHLFSQSTSYKSFSVLVSSDRRVSYSVNKPAINYSVIWSVPGQWSQFFFQTTSHKSFSQLVSPRTGRCQLQSINQQYMHIIWSVGKSLGGRLESANQSINQRYISCKSFRALVSSLTVESVT